MTTLLIQNHSGIFSPKRGTLHIVRPKSPCRLLAHSRTRIDTRRASSNLARARHVNASNRASARSRAYYTRIQSCMACANCAVRRYPRDCTGTRVYTHTCCAYAWTRNYCTSARKHSLHVEAKTFRTLYTYIEHHNVQKKEIEEKRKRKRKRKKGYTHTQRHTYTRYTTK